MARLSLLMALREEQHCGPATAVRDTALPHWGCQNQIPPFGDEALQQGSALCLLGSGLCTAELPQEEKATPSAALSGCRNYQALLSLSWGLEVQPLSPELH